MVYRSLSEDPANIYSLLLVAGYLKTPAKELQADCLTPRDKKHPGIIMELKSETGLNEEELEALSAEALNQINDKRYDAEMRSDGVESILKLGIAFSGKKLKIAVSLPL